MKIESNRWMESVITRFTQFTSFVRLGVAWVVIEILLVVPAANAQTKLATGDKIFILAAAQSSMTEVKLGELVAQKGTRDDVKEFAEMMVKDHKTINGNLKWLAGQKGVALSDSLDAKHQEKVNKMAALTGSDFDNAYIAEMVNEQKIEADVFKTESSETQDADIKSFVNQSFPVVTQHLERISSIKK